MLNAIVLFLMIITQVLGDVCLSNAMKIYGEITSFSLVVIIDVISYLFNSPWFYLSLINLTLSWFLYLFCVSKMDLSYVLPINSSGYICNALFAWLLLQESVTPTRWFATGLISLGVFIVGYSKYIAKKEKHRDKLPSHLAVNPHNFNQMLMTLPTGIFLPAVWLGVMVMVLADSIGDILNAKGMRQIEPITSLTFSAIFQWLLRIFSNINIIIGITCQFIALFLLISLLSWGDLSFIRPASAISYLITITFAKYILQEKISKERLMGISLIMIGVITLSLS